MVSFQEILEVSARVLTASIRVMDQASGRLSARKRNEESIDDILASNPLARSPTDNRFGLQIYGHGQVQPTLTRAHVRDD